MNKKKPSQEGTLSLKNGEDKEVDVKYNIAKLQYDFFTSQVKSKSDLQVIADKASLEAKSNCKFTPTYQPISISFMAQHDTITVFIDFTAKNAFGVAGTESSIFKFKGSTFIGKL